MIFEINLPAIEIIGVPPWLLGYPHVMIAPTRKTGDPEAKMIRQNENISPKVRVDPVLVMWFISLFRHRKSLFYSEIFPEYIYIYCIYYIYIYITTGL